MEMRQIASFPLYKVSDTGIVLSQRGTPLKPWRHKLGGYPIVALRKNGRTYRKCVHKLVAETFLSGTGPIVRHKDGNPLNNCVENLAWGTQSENILDMVQHGTHNNARKTHCKRGHEFTEENTVNNHGNRACRICTNENHRTNKQKHRENK